MVEASAAPAPAQRRVPKRSGGRHAVVPPLSDGHEAGWVAHMRNLEHLYTRKTAKALFEITDDLHEAGTAAQALDSKAGSINAGVGKYLDLADGERSLIRRMLREANFGPNVDHPDVVKFCRELVRRYAEIEKNEDELIREHAKLSKLITYARLKIDLSPVIRFQNELKAWGMAIVLIVSVPFAIIDGLDNQVTDAIRPYSSIGVGIAVVAFTLLKAKNLWDAGVQAQEVRKQLKELEKLQKAKPGEGIPRLRPYKIKSRGRLAIWNERWADWRADQKERIYSLFGKEAPNRHAEVLKENGSHPSAGSGLKENGTFAQEEGIVE